MEHGSMGHANALLWEVSFWEFVFVTVALGGGAAFMAGRATASQWMGNGKLVIYMCLLALAVRFIHFALFSGTLLSIQYYLADLVVLLLIAFVGRRLTRSRQMATQYSFAFERAGLMSWNRRR